MNDIAIPKVPLLDLDLLRTLVAIADGGSFSAAAEEVHRTPSAISMQVKRIEDILGRAVFTRDSRSVSLTADGERVLEHARRMLALNREVMAQFVAPEVVGEVRLGAADDVAERILPDLLRRFAQTHPGVVINVRIESSAKMMQMIAAKTLDLAIVTCEQDAQKDSRLEILFRERLVWAMLRFGVAAEQDPLPLSVWDEGCIWRKAGVERLRAQGRDYRIAFQSAHISGQRASILADLAVAPIAESSLGEDIVEVPEHLNLPQLPHYALGLAMRKDAPPPVDAAADLLRTSFAAV